MPQKINPTAHHPMSLTLEERPADLPKEQTIIAYCRGAYCILSFDAVKSLREKGYKARRLAERIGLNGCALTRGVLGNPQTSQCTLVQRQGGVCEVDSAAPSLRQKRFGLPTPLNSAPPDSCTTALLPQERMSLMSEPLECLAFQSPF
jgi:hypothetical protein